MTADAVARLSTKSFRAGTAYDLVVFDRLSRQEQAALLELRADPDFYGVLRPKPGTGRTIKTVDRETALLWLTLKAPGALPFYVFSGDAESSIKAISQLVLDGVLEMEEGGRFVTGAEAADVLSGGRRANATGRLALLSNAALRYGESLRMDDPLRLAARLYGFGRQPVSPRWARRLPDREAVLTFLGAEKGSALRRRLDAGWEEAEAREAQGWIAWSKRGRSENGGVARVNHKLYVSPSIDALPAVFPQVLDVLSTRAGHFKIGNQAAGLLRPDKMVLYFRDRESLLEVASELSARLVGTSVHGVPFSAEITADGLLSWGMDPPWTQRVLAWQEPESWRLWVVRRLAAAMIAAQSDPGSTMTPAEFALERLRHEGVDVEGWTPAASIWAAA